MGEAKSKPAKIESPWDKKKIIFFSILTIVLLILGFAVKDSILGKSYIQNPKIQNVKSVGTQINLRKDVQDQINTLKEEAGNINLVDVATSSPQVQKVINDLKALKDYPNNQLKQTCMNVCSKL
jgi:hypothetical protein